MQYCIVWDNKLGLLSKRGSRRRACPLKIHYTQGAYFRGGAYFREGAYYPDYTVYMETRTSHRAVARCFGSGTFTHFVTLPTTLATCQPTFMSNIEATGQTVLPF